MKVSMFEMYGLHLRTHTGVINFIKQYKIYTRENNFLSQSQNIFYIFKHFFLQQIMCF